MVAKKTKNEKDLYQIPVFHLREEAAQKKGTAGRNFPFRILSQLGRWEYRYRKAYPGTIGMLQDLGQVQEQLYEHREYVQEAEPETGP